ncbi:hypothetical protein HMPREF9372_1481 [Sporosarcina newyorkensis 2681]|uniref:DUF4181 domain-containing protein n=1 Tax=Sporosarcina newyorkensis 2681 TaxID=1027292 RepID=F9DRQ1_9BACL|nr:DUF4181 domain-containing protein [Sporosarcina newyorkensis]EGQ26554.1 hypothetical protein HMPREF9372_1481 [Sporosarcina newyorkensis 2681]
MIYFGVGSSFWIAFFLLLFVVWLLFFSFTAIMRKILNVEKKKLFSYNHVNASHKKMDWTIRIVFIIAIIAGSSINISRHPSDRILFLEPYVLLFALIFITEIITAIMEWKYAENKNAYILTISQLVLFAVVLLSIYSTDFFGLFG